LAIGTRIFRDRDPLGCGYNSIQLEDSQGESTTIPIMHVGGIAIRAHGSSVVAFVGLFILFAAGVLPGVLPNEQQLTYWSVAFTCTLFIFLSTIAHELGHSLVARARGVAVNAITLVLFGGSSDISRSDERPIDETLIAVAGPGASLLVALALLGVRFSIPEPRPSLETFLVFVIAINLWLAVFNLLPTLPLDGGRALRGLLWHGIGDYRKATRIASIIGQGLAALMFLAGGLLFIVTIDRQRSPFPTLLGFDSQMVAIVVLLVAWFINRGARAAYRQVVLEGRFAGVKVEQIMTTEPPTVAAWTSLDQIVTAHFLQRGERSVAVVRDDNYFMGIVAYSDVRKISRSNWGTRAAGEVMTPAARILSVTPDDELDIAIRHMAERHLNQLPVLTEGRLVGMITRANILRFLDLDNRRS
jgi:Zn-dependent protease/predicted transcriptional regulator